MILPNKIKIANHIFKIIDWNSNEANSNNKFGEADMNNLIIKINTGFSDSHTKETLLHEINHCIFWAYNMKEGDNEERIVTTISIGLSQVFNDNPKIYKFLNTGK